MADDTSSGAAVQEQPPEPQTQAPPASSPPEATASPPEAVLGGGPTPLAPIAPGAPPAYEHLKADQEAAGGAIEPFIPEAGSSLGDIAAGLFFVADDAGEPEVSMVGPHTISMLYEDGSVVRGHFESRPGMHRAVGGRAANQVEAELRNKSHTDSKKIADDRLASAQDAAKAQAEA